MRATGGSSAATATSESEGGAGPCPARLSRSRPVCEHPAVAVPRGSAAGAPQPTVCERLAPACRGYCRPPFRGEPRTPAASLPDARGRSPRERPTGKHRKLRTSPAGKANIRRPAEWPGRCHAGAGTGGPRGQRRTWILCIPYIHTEQGGAGSRVVRSPVRRSPSPRRPRAVPRPRTRPWKRRTTAGRPAPRVSRASDAPAPARRAGSTRSAPRAPLLPWSVICR